jgi:metal-sulfur cluster biosynthetic enzyme
MNTLNANPPSPTTEDVWRTLATIPDPEFGLSIVDLDLIYDVACTDGAVRVVMTLTTPTCPSGGWIYEGVRVALGQIPGVTAVVVDVTFDPPWSPEMLTPAARDSLGIKSHTASV